MFKSLRERLKGVSKKLEDEVEKQLGDQLERELAASMAKPEPPVAPAQPATAPPIPREPAPAPDVAPAHREPDPTTPAPASRPEPQPSPAPVETPPAPSVPVTPPFRVEPASEVVHHQPDPTKTQPPVPAPGPSPAPQSTPLSPLTQPPPGSTSASSVAGQVPKPVLAPILEPTRPVSSPPPQPKPQAPKPQPAERTAPKPNVTGRKMLTEEEISARLERELTEAVQVQKAVEEVVQTVAPAARFTINEQVLEDILWELEVGLLESDVALPVIEAIKANVKEQILTLTVGGKPEEVVEAVLRTAITKVLQVNPLVFDDFVRARMKVKTPVVIMFVGVNGTGKTTSIGRLAWRLKEQGIGVVMAAGDTFRAGAIEQLALHGERLGITVIKHKAGADPAAVAYDAVEHAKARNKQVVLLDTAGRMQNNSNLMDEMDKIRRVANPDLCIFVGDSLAGNDAVEQARKFDEIVDVGGVILTKVDVDAKGGAALSVAYTINKPLLFVGVGQDYPDLKPFDAEWLVNRLFGDEAEAAA
ncbi:MAG TPA: signal recognition particle-docking protein FtsY [Candidatus Thermoplasmatota archaeon]|nr:signal recognition particle-docking protein FtsY [Candidatus Thermoplasmatota archaeon]